MAAKLFDQHAHGWSPVFVSRDSSVQLVCFLGNEGFATTFPMEVGAELVAVNHGFDKGEGFSHAHIFRRLGEKAVVSAINFHAVSAAIPFHHAAKD
jgi:hypothetical protein